MDRDQIAPYSLEAEMAALGCMFLSERAARKVAGALRTEMFYRPAHRVLFRAMRDLALDGQPCDPVTVPARLGQEGLATIGGEEYMMQVAEYVPSPGNAEWYASTVREKWVRREAVERSKRVIEAAYQEESVEDLLAIANQMGRGLDPDGSDTVLTSDDDPPQSQMAGIKLGIPALDATGELGQGLPRSEMTVVGAMTGNGKTAFLTSTAARLAQTGRKVAYATLEMPAWKIKRRMVQALCGWWQQPRSLMEQAGYDQAVQTVKGWGMPIWDPSNRISGEKTVERLVAWAHEMNDSFGTEVLLVDYAQLLYRTGRQESRLHELVKIADDLLWLAKRTKMAVVAGAQLTKPQVGDPEIKDCRTFSHHAAWWFNLALPPIPERSTTSSTWDAIISVRKSRDGGAAVVPAKFNWRYQRFEDLNSSGEYDPYADS